DRGVRPHAAAERAECGAIHRLRRERRLGSAPEGEMQLRRPAAERRRGGEVPTLECNEEGRRSRTFLPVPPILPIPARTCADALVVPAQFVECEFPSRALMFD